MARRTRPTAHRGAKPVYVICGSESYLRSRAIDRVLKDDLAVGVDTPAYVSFEGGAELAEVLDELRTLPLFSDHRTVVVRDADSFVTRYRSALEDYCSAPCESATLILMCDRFDARTRLYKIVAQTGVIEKCEPLKRWQVKRWIIEHAGSVYGQDMDERAAGLLQDLVGDELGALDSELNKLSIYVADRGRITVQDVEQLVGLHREERVFGIADAIAGREPGAALALWEQVWLTDRAAPGRAIGGLAWALRRYLDARIELEQGGDYEKLARRFWVEPEALQRRLGRFSVADLEHLMLDLVKTDLGVKTGLHHTRSGVEKYIVRHCLTE